MEPTYLTILPIVVGLLVGLVTIAYAIFSTTDVGRAYEYARREQKKEKLKRDVNRAFDYKLLTADDLMMGQIKDRVKGLSGQVDRLQARIERLEKRKK